MRSFFFPIFLIRSVASMLEQLLPCHCRGFSRNPQVLGNVTAAVQPKICPANAWLSLGSCVSGNQKATRCFGRGRTCWFGAELETKKTRNWIDLASTNRDFSPVELFFCTKLQR